MNPRVLLLLVALAAVAWIFAATYGSSSEAVTEDASLAPSSTEPSLGAAPAVEPAQLDLNTLEAAAELLSREEAVLGDPSETIHGRVLTLTGSPASGAAVSLWMLAEEWTDPLQQIGSENSGAIYTVADEQGKFSFKDLHLSRYGLTAEKGKRRQYYFPAVPGQFLEIRLGDSGTVRGRLECELHGAETFSGVAAMHGVWSRAGFGAVPIRADGSFELEHVPVGRSSLQLYVDRHDQGYGTRIQIRKPGETVDLIVKLWPACTIRGKVLDVVTRAPIAGAVVRSDAHYNEPATLTDAAGNFVLVNARMARTSSFDDPTQAPTHQINAAAPGYLDGVAEVILSEDELEPQEHTCTVLLSPGISVSGRLVNERGRPLEDVNLTLSQGHPYLVMFGDSRPPDCRMEGRTDAEGRFNLSWSSDRPTLISIDSARTGNWSRNLGKFSSSRDLGDLQVPDPGSIPVLVVDDAGAPIAAAEVRLESKGKKDQYDQAEASPPNSSWFQSQYQYFKTDSAGRCTLFRPPTFPAEISVRIPYGVQDWEFPLASRSADSREDLRLTLKGLRTITGQVRHADGAPAKCSVMLRQLDDSSKYWRILSDPDGSFRARASFLDQYDVLVSVHESMRAGTVQYSGLAFSTKPLALIMPKFLPVQGRVVDGRGHPVVDASIAVYMFGESSYWDKTDADGRFRIDLPSEGAAELAASVGPLILPGFDDLNGKRVAVTPGQSGIVLVAPEPKKKE